MRYVVREGKQRGAGRYWAGFVMGWINIQSAALKYTERAVAEHLLTRRDLMPNGARIVRLLTRDEAKRRYAAEVLRELIPFAENHRIGESYAGAEIAFMLAEQAAALWPAGAKGAKGKRR